MYLDRQTIGNSVDPDQMLENAASDQGQHCLPLIQQFYTHSQAVKWTMKRSTRIGVKFRLNSVFRIYPKFPMKVKGGVGGGGGGAGRAFN